MKKRIIFSAVIAILALTACQKDDSYKINEEEEIVSPVFTASIGSQDSKTTINVSDGKVSWEESDEITVTNENSQLAKYIVKSIDKKTGKATFVIKDGETPLTGNSFTATYGTAPSNSQTYSDKAGKLYMTAPSTESRSFTFTVQCALLKINLTKSGESIKSISVTSADGKNTYTLTCESAQDISSAKDFYIAVPAGNYNKFVIKNNSNVFCYLTAASSISAISNKIKKVTLSNKLIFICKEGAFSVSDSKKVAFAKGNIYKTSEGIYQIETQQYNFHTSGATGTNYAYVDGKINNAGANGYAKFNSDEYKEILKKFPGHFPLTTSEWDYLITDRSTSCVGIDADNPRWTHCKINDIVYGLLLFPDNSTWPDGVTKPSKINAADYNWSAKTKINYSIDDFHKLENAGFIFLPAVGRLNNTTAEYSCFTGGDYSVGCYVNESDAEHCLKFTNHDVSSNNTDGGSYGCGVRLSKNL